MSVKVLKELVAETVVLPADELFPDCVFIEDTAVVVDGVALITIPGIYVGTHHTQPVYSFTLLS